MKNFEYASPTTEAEVLEHLRDFPSETEFIAGGTDLVGLMQKMVITPKRVVNLLEVPSFRDVEVLDGGVVSMGATVTLDTVLVHPYLNPYPGLRDAIDGIASLQIQCQGTLGGEILRPATAAGPNGRFGVIRDPAGAVCALFETMPTPEIA